MNRTCSLVVALAFSLLSLRVNAQTPSAATEKPKTITERLEAVESLAELLNGWVGGIESRTGNRVTKLQCDTGNFAFLMIESGTLPLLASCAKIEPYLEGYKLTIHIGNPLSMKFDGISGTISYGEDWLKSLGHKVPFTMVDSLRPGVWSIVSVVINRAEAKDVRYIALGDVAINSASGVPR